METYLTLLYVTLDQELALKEFFIEKGWTYCKPDLGVMTDRVGPFKNPQSMKTRNGKILTYCIPTENDGSVTNNTARVVKKKGAGKQLKSRTVRGVKAEVSRVEEEFSNDFSEVKVEIDGNADLTSDADNADDFADELEVPLPENISSDTEFLDSQHENQGTKSAKINESTTRSRSSRRQAGVQPNSGNSQKGQKVAANDDSDIDLLMDVQVEKEDGTKPKPVDALENFDTQTAGRRVPGSKRKCTECSREYRLQYHLDKHMKQAHDPENPPKPKRKPLPCQCDICGSVFKRTYYLNEHKKIVHQGIKKKNLSIVCTCEICGSSFKRRDHLREHVLVKHSNSERPFPCSLCDQSFMRPGRREHHVNKDHLKVKPYNCTFCNKKFYNQCSVKKHITSKVCRPDRIDQFKCIKCEKTFANSSNLEMHMTAIHFGGAYRCVCGETVKWSGSIAKHKRRCKTYQEYITVHGEVEDKVCNVIEVPYSEVLVENVVETNATAKDNGNNKEDSQQDTGSEWDTEQDLEHEMDQSEQDIEWC